MKYLLVLGTASLSLMKVSFQSALAKKYYINTGSSAYFNMLIFLFSALLFVPYAFKASPYVWAFGAAYAVCNMAFQTTYTLALSSGNVSAAVMFVNFGMLVPVAVSYFAFEDRPSILRWAGIVLMITALAVMVKPDGTSSRKGIIFGLISMLLNGAGLSVQKFFANSAFFSENLSFVAVSYIFSTVLCAVFCLARFRLGIKKVIFENVRAIPYAIGSGVSLGLFLAINTYAAKVTDGSFHYPAHSCSVTLLSVLTGVVLFRDRVSRRQIIACVLVTFAIVLMNF